MHCKYAMYIEEQICVQLQQVLRDGMTVIDGVSITIPQHKAHCSVVFFHFFLGLATLPLP